MCVDLASTLEIDVSKAQERTLPDAVKKSLADLHQLFPARALGLITALRIRNNHAKQFPEWRQEQIEKLGMMVIESAMDLERAYFETRITTLAWATRNLLELSIWIDYCNLSNQHAKQFFDDWIRDLYGLSKAVGRVVEVESGQNATNLDRALKDLSRFAESTGIRALEDHFKGVYEAARELGRLPEFRAANKVLSKFAHPTAWAVRIATVPGPNAGYFDMFLQDGVFLAMNGIITIRKVIRSQYPEIATSKQE
jgi:hypothetical protein